MNVPGVPLESSEMSGVSRPLGYEAGTCSDDWYQGSGSIMLTPPPLPPRFTKYGTKPMLDQAVWLKVSEPPAVLETYVAVPPSVVTNGEEAGYSTPPSGPALYPLPPASPDDARKLMPIAEPSM